jgi:hypothetical protein
MALLFSASLVLGLFLGERTLPGITNHVLVPVVALVVICFSFAGFLPFAQRRTETKVAHHRKFETASAAKRIDKGPILKALGD